MNLSVLVLFLVFPLVNGHFDNSTCGKQKKCIFVPPGCENRNDCRQLFSYSASEDGWVDMEMFSTNDVHSNNYVAVGFSEDDHMGDDPVTGCVFPDGGEPTVHFSYNVGKSNSPPESNDDKAAEEKNLKLVHAHKGEDGMYCHFRQKSTTGENKFAPDLNKKYVIFLARGKADNPRSLGIHGLEFNSPDYPYISEKMINVAEVRKRDVQAEVPTNASDPALQPKKAEDAAPVSSMSRETKFWLIRVHGMLMIFAWLVLVVSAILSARYLRDHFPSSSPCGLKWWFHIHRTLNIVALPFILLSTLLIFIAKEWTWEGPSVNNSASANFSPGSVHSLLGTIAILVAIIQPLLALMRCQPDTGARPIFNWTHRSLGVLGIVFAVVAIMIAANSFVSLWSDASWGFLVMIFYVLVAVLSIALFEVLSYLKSKAPSKTAAMEMRNRTSHRYDDAGKVVSSPPRIVNKKPLYGVAALYLVFLLFSLCVAALLIVMLSV
ncbi:hypothetical protein RB195_006026 [Necator americanus]|uniref:Cytochrome b561 domain-containing protein n=1 Tax=Necator americanus TaxID=51031 RepID=A0ABR1BSH5_NECAM